MTKRLAVFAFAALAAFGAQATGSEGDIRSVEAVFDWKRYQHDTFGYDYD